MQPQVILLHLGHMDVANLQHRDEWEKEFDQIMRCIRAPALRHDTRCDLYLRLTLTEEAVGTLSFTFHIQRDMFEVRTAGRATVESVIKKYKSMLKSITRDSWNVLDASGLARQRRLAWERLHSAQHYILYFVEDLGRTSFIAFP